jgi:hypothetical protein
VRSEHTRGVGSRIAGRGSLLRSLRVLLHRVRRYGEHRAASADELRWMARLYDGLTAVFDEALGADGARASLRAVDERRRISSKTAGRIRPTTPNAGVFSDAQ